MNWITFIIASWVCLGLDLGLRESLQIGNLSIAPSFTIALLAFIGLWASTTSALWSAIILGVLLDLVNPVHTTDDAMATVVGPYALGCLLGMSAVINLRAVMFRKSILTQAFLTLVLMVIAEIVVTFSLSFRQWYDVINFGQPIGELLLRLGSALYTALVVLLPFGFILTLTLPAFNFHHAAPRLSFTSH